ncbi:MAG: DNA-binding response regulator [Candidatus Scalindua rubra]|uniref:DNA-binding response regulator n=1 Tax=Candidatus Scalindua rubra TaxID=1872076 RepID=A0A1E3XGP4_9BACT|nr:MAG: DNA-binding response regulator [Candidatus Scalindua rubra]
MSIRVVVADDHKLVRDGLRSLLEKQKGMEVVAETEDGRTTVQQVQKQSPDVVIMDISMHDLNGVDATRQIIAKSPRVKVLALSIHSDRRFVAGILSAGASGYLLKDSGFVELADAIRIVVSNQTYLSPRIAGIVAEDYVNRRTATDATAHSILTAREREVLQLIAEGKSTKQTARHLQVSVKTIESHRQNIMEKLGIYSVAELTKYAVREGLTSL